MTFLILAALLTQDLPVRSVQIWSVDPIPVDIEWISIDASGKQTVTSRRKTAVGPPVALDFTHGPDRFVRFSYAGAAPRTFSTAELIAAKKLHVPDVLPGGEMLLFVPPMNVRPVQLLVAGPRAQTVNLTSAPHSSLSGVPPGEYRITPVYEGGLKGAMQTATVKTAATTLALMPAEEVGAVRIVAPEDVCTGATEMLVNQLVNADVGPMIRTPPNRVRIVSSKEPRCEMTVGGLKAGAFETLFRREALAMGRSEFDIAPQAVSTAHVAGTHVLVEGRLTMNGRPMREAQLSFLTAAGNVGAHMEEAATLKADANGFYSVRLEKPGAYIVRLIRRATFGATPKPVTFTEGRNFHDIALSGGVITLELTGRPPGAAIEVRLQGSNSMMSSTFSAQLNERPSFEGLPFGEYKVAVMLRGQGPREWALPDAKTAIITPSSPEATLRFDLRKK